jgi:hypothetical protein
MWRRSEKKPGTARAEAADADSDLVTFESLIALIRPQCL